MMAEEKENKTLSILIGIAALVGGGIALYYFLKKETPSPPPPGKATINIVTNPSEAEIHINGGNTGYVTPHTFTVDPGEYEVIIVKLGYEGWNGTRTLSSGSTWNINATLTPTEIKKTLLVTYCSSEDYNAANLIREELTDSFSVVLRQSAPLSDFDGYDMVAIVGGNQAWEGCSQNLYTLMGFASPTETEDRCLRYVIYDGAGGEVLVYGIAGWLLSDTEWLANIFQTFAKDDILPTTTTCY